VPPATLLITSVPQERRMLARILLKKLGLFYGKHLKVSPTFKVNTCTIFHSCLIPRSIFFSLMFNTLKFSSFFNMLPWKFQNSQITPAVASQITHRNPNFKKVDDDSHKSVGQCKIRDGGGDGNKQGGGCASGVETRWWWCSLTERNWVQLDSNKF